jgi:hypothetical protein
MTSLGGYSQEFRVDDQEPDLFMSPPVEVPALLGARPSFRLYRRRSLGSSIQDLRQGTSPFLLLSIGAVTYHCENRTGKEYQLKNEDPPHTDVTGSDARRLLAGGLLLQRNTQDAN